MSNASDFIIENGVLTKYVGSGGDVVIPDGITEIGANACSYSMLESVVIPEGVVKIGMGAFSGNHFRKVILPQSLSEIGANAFGLCLELTDIIIPDAVQKIGSKAFNHCVSLQSVIVGDSVKTIGSDAFRDTKWLKGQAESVIYAGKVLIQATIENDSFSIPSGVIGIGANAFGECENMRVVKIPDSVQGIETKAFAQCRNLERMIIEGKPEVAKDAIPESTIVIAANISIDDIKSKQLKHQVVLGSFFLESEDNVVPTSVTKYITKNFDRMIPDIQRVPELLERIIQRNVLQKAHVDRLLEELQGNANCCAALLAYKNSHFSNEQLEFDAKQFKGLTAAELKKQWKPTTLSDGSLEVSGYHGDELCVYVPSVIGKKHVSSIGSCCFYSSSFDQSNRKYIKIIDIPDGIVNIGERAFVGCKALIEIHIPVTVNSIGDYAFWECSSVSIHAPVGSYAEQYAKENHIPFVAE